MSQGMMKIRDQVIVIPNRLESKVYKPPEFAQNRHIILLEYECVTCNQVHPLASGPIKRPLRGLTDTSKGRLAAL